MTVQWLCFTYSASVRTTKRLLKIPQITLEVLLSLDT